MYIENSVLMKKYRKSLHFYALPQYRKKDSNIKLLTVKNMLESYTCKRISFLFFEQSLGQELIKRLNQSRFHLKETLSHREKESKQSQANASLQRAQAMAKDILNLSQSDLEDIMSADGDPERMVYTVVQFNIICIECFIDLNVSLI